MIDDASHRFENNDLEVSREDMEVIVVDLKEHVLVLEDEMQL